MKNKRKTLRRKQMGGEIKNMKTVNMMEISLMVREKAKEQ
jgi:hypothetical protein